MRHWVSVYNTVTSPRRTTATLIRRPKCSTAIYRRIHEYATALKAADHQYNLDSVRTLGAYSTRQATILQTLAQENDEHEEENDGHEGEDEGHEDEDEEENLGEEEDDMEEEGDGNADDVDVEDDMEKEEDMNDSITDNNKDETHCKLDDYLDTLNGYIKKRFLTGTIPRPDDINTPKCTTSLPFLLLNKATELVMKLN